MRKAIFNLMAIAFIILGALAMLGSAGACDSNAIGIGQALLQIIFSAIAVFIGALCAMKGKL